MNSIQNKTNNKSGKKILVFGLDNSGKTSIIFSLKEDSTIMPFWNLKPTYGLKIEGCDTDDEKYYMWDFGGQESYREEHLKTLPDKITKTEQLIYVFDVQDMERYEVALNYFEQIMTRIDNINLELLIYLHKYDPFLEQNPNNEVNQKLEEFIPKIKEKIPAGLDFKIFKTCILTKFRKLPV